MQDRDVGKREERIQGLFIRSDSRVAVQQKRKLDRDCETPKEKNEQLIKTQAGSRPGKSD